MSCGKGEWEAVSEILRCSSVWDDMLFDERRCRREPCCSCSACGSLLDSRVFSLGDYSFSVVPEWMADVWMIVVSQDLAWNEVPPFGRRIVAALRGWENKSERFRLEDGFSLQKVKWEWCFPIGLLSIWRHFVLDCRRGNLCVSRSENESDFIDLWWQ